MCDNTKRKKCCSCKKELYLSEFHNNRRSPDNKAYVCKHCKKLDNPQRAARQLELRRTNLRSFLTYKYSEMKRRVSSTHRRDSIYYYGVELLPKEEFVEWGLKHPDLIQLFEEWNEAKWPVKLCPSIDRIDPRFGYHVLNMQWVTHSENVIRSNIFRTSGKII